MVSFISSENVADVAFHPPVRLWCVISFAELCLIVTIKDDNCSNMLPSHILTIHVKDLPIFWESSWPRNPVTSEGSLAQIASVNAGFCGFSSVNEGSNRVGG